MPLRSMDSEMPALKESGRIGSIAKANGRNDGRSRFPLSRSGGVQPYSGNSRLVSPALQDSRDEKR